MNEEQVTYACEYCGEDFEIESDYQLHEKKCIFKNQDKDICSAVFKIRQYCDKQECPNCKYFLEDINECFFSDPPHGWRQNR